MNPIPFPGRLDLTENLMLLMHPGGMLIADQRAPHECADAPHWVWNMPGDAAPLAVYLVIEAQAQDADEAWHTPSSVIPEAPHEAYGNRVLQAKVTFPGGLAEDWTLRVDPLQVGFDWIRQPHLMGGRCAFVAHSPAASNALQFWRTLEGEQTRPLWDGRPRQNPEDAYWQGEASGVLLYSALPRASMRLDVTTNGPLRIDVREATAPLDTEWQLHWTIVHGQLIRMSGNLGLRAASRNFYQHARAGMADASIDFGAYYEEVILGGLALLTDDMNTIRAACLDPTGSIAPASLDEIAIACESLGLCAPTLTAEILERQLLALLTDETLPALTGRGLDLPDACAPGLLMMMAGRHLRLTGDLTLIEQHQLALRNHAEALLALRRPGEALPIFSLAHVCQHHVKQPAGTAVVYAGLSRWAAIEERLGNSAEAQRFAEAAHAMQWAAIAPVESGGLWHQNRGSFINYLPVEVASPRHLQPNVYESRGAELDFGQQVLAFWLGLCPDEDLIRRSMEWIDYSYTYASGRGGPSYPPGYQRAFHALLDVAVRMRYGCGEVGPLLQRALDNGARTGLPFSRDVRGRALPAGSMLDNSPYFEIVLRRHYGLDYDAGGWRLSNPRPIGNYPLTRVTSLRHRNASYAVTWQGRGTIQRVTLNGAPHPSRVLDKPTGDHEVLVTLA